MRPRATPKDIDDYITAFPPKVRSILQKIRQTIRRAAPKAEERISYRMPAFFQDGVLVYFAGFTNHIGMYPPIYGDAQLDKDLERYRGPKGNLRFPLDEPIPYGLITKLVKFRLQEKLGKAASKRKKI